MALKRGHPSGEASSVGPLRKSHLSNKENLLRDPSARERLRGETVRRLFAAVNQHGPQQTTRATVRQFFGIRSFVFLGGLKAQLRGIVLTMSHLSMEFKKYILHNSMLNRSPLQKVKCIISS